MRASLGITILVMGLLGVLAAAATGETYQRLALDNQRQAFLSLVKLKIHEIIQDLTQDAFELGLSAQASSGFLQALRNHNPGQLQAKLDEHFHRVFVTLGRVKLIKLYALDKNMQLLGASTLADPDLPGNKTVCNQHLQKILKRTRAARLKPDAELCLAAGQPALSAIVPVGGLRIKGYLQLIIDPSPNLAKAEQGLGTPLSLHGLTNSHLYESPDWPKELDKNILLAKYDLFSPQQQRLFRLSFASDITGLRKQLASTRKIIFSIAAIILLSTTLFALFLLQRTTLTPLNILSNHLRQVQKDKSRLDTKVEITGNTEIVALANDFNMMSSELSTLYRTLEKIAFTDTLTAMPNRVLFNDRLERATLNAERYNSPFVLMMMDLNRFKNINDTLGHHVGDQLLKTVGQRLQTVLRKSDTVARLGGDEFAAILLAVDSDEDTTIVAQKIVNSLDEPIHADGRTLSIGISIGMACYPRDGDNPSLLMQRADIAMYRAKREGLGFAFYDNSMDSDNLFELTMESELRQAMENNDFELYYQPKIDIQKKCITGVEALIRWTHKEHGFISPEKFIPLAEQTGLIKPLTEWVLEQALHQCKNWHRQEFKLGVSVNLSAYSLNDIDLLDTVRRSLARAGIAPQWLTLELTETAIMSDADRALSTLSRLNSMNVRLSVDDFGTGYSSLAYLKRFPVNEIKIDKSFVMDMLDDTSDAVIVRSTIDLAHNMGMEVVAEGIESQDALDVLSGLGCDSGQGYHLCRPCPAAELEQWLKESSWGLEEC